jgi:beta-lactamase regulating signal transducer with metallopeptidase domain
MIPSGLGSPEWANLVKALLHTLWQGMVLAGLLGLALRGAVNPVIRYRCALGALGGVVLAGLVTWGLLSRPLPRADVTAPIPAPAVTAPVPAMAPSDLPPVVVNFQMPPPKPPEANWLAWLALFWLAGTVAMLGRAGWQVAGAERLRRASRPLDDARITALLAEARAAMGLARRVRIAATDQLSSPVVAGVLVPTLILPLTLTTTLTPEQIHFVLLHELAHIRRGDYFANLFQLLTEALLFFNPAVWWISRQVRLEREACCDALAVELSGAPADYARTLLRVVEHVVSPPPTAAPAFRGEHGPSSLADRVQRMLVPGYRPALRLTWRAMIAALLAGGVLLCLSALGTRITVAEMLPSPKSSNPTSNEAAGNGQIPVSPTNSVGTLNDTNSPVEKVELKPEPGIDGSGERETKLRATGLNENPPSAFPRLPATEAETNVQVLITARFYRMPAARFNDVVSGLKFNQGNGSDGGWWSISPVEAVRGHPLRGLDSPDAILLSQPRIQIRNGSHAQLNLGILTNKLDLNLTASVSNELVDMAIQGQFVEGTGDPTATNQFDANAQAENLGGLVIRGKNANLDAANEFAAILTVQILTNGLSVSEPSSAEPMTNAGPAAQGEAPAQVHIKARFYKVPKGTADEIDRFLNLTNSVDGRRIGILDQEQLKAILTEMSSRSGIAFMESLGEPEITTQTGRRTHVRPMDSVAVFPNKKGQGEQINSNGIPPNGKTIELGPSLDALTRVLADGNTISLETTASVTEWPPIQTESGSAKVNLYDDQTLLMYLNTVEPARSAEPKPDPDAAMAKNPSNAQRNTANEIFVLVTATQVDAAGNRVHGGGANPSGNGKIPPQPKATDAGVESKESSSGMITTSTATAPHGTSTLVFSSSGRAAIMAKLKGIRMTDVVFDGLPLNEVLKQLAGQCRLADPEHKGVRFLITLPSPAAQPRGTRGGPQIDPNTGLPVEAAKVGVGTNLLDVGSSIVKTPELTNACLADVLDAIVLTSDLPIQYSVEDLAVVFSAKQPETPPQLFMRTFRLDPGVFDFERAQISLDNLRQVQTNPGFRALGDAVGSQQIRGQRIFATSQAKNPTPSALARAFFISQGIDLNNPPGKSVFFNEQLGLLFVKATESDLTNIERALEALNQVPPQVHLKVRFYKAPVGAIERLRQSFTDAEMTNGMFRSILTRSNTSAILHTLASQPEFQDLGEPEITVISGRQTQMSVTEYVPVAVAGGVDGSTGRPQTEFSSVRTGPAIDVVPYVLADGYTINLALIPSDTGLDGRWRPVPGNSNVVELPVVLPKFTTRQFVSTANVWDSQTVVLGGLSSSMVYAMKDKVPIAGDLPWVGKYFQSQSGQTNQNELLIFVTATIVDPAGSRVHTEEELPFAQTGVPVQPPQVAVSLKTVSSTAGIPAAFPKVGPSTTNTLVSTEAKLESIRIHDVSYDALPLREVLKQLSVQCRLQDPEHQGINFLINHGPRNGRNVPQIDAATGLLVARDAGNGTGTNGPNVGDYTIKIPKLTNVRVADVLDAIVLTCDHPIQYSVEDFAVVFSDKDPNALFERTFLVNRKAFDAQSHPPTGDKPNVVSTEVRTDDLPELGVYDFSRSRQNKDGLVPFTSETAVPPPGSFVRAFFDSIGVDLVNPPGKAVFINGLGMLSVTATESDLEKVEQALRVLPPPPQVHLKARFYAMDVSDSNQPGFDQYLGQISLTNLVAGTVTRSGVNPRGASAGSTGSTVPNDARSPARITGILTDPVFRGTSLKTLTSRPGVQPAGEFEITTLNGRPTLMPANADGGPALEVTSYVLADGYTNNLGVFEVPTASWENNPPARGQAILMANINIPDNNTLVLGGWRGHFTGINTNSAGQAIPQPEKELLVFITATMVDPAGSRVHTDEELPFAQKGVPVQKPPQ